jgi:hypothetical protein
MLVQKKLLNSRSASRAKIERFVDGTGTHAMARQP